MKTLLLILLVLTISTPTLKAESLSGQAKLDSLLAELPKAKGDTNEVNLLNTISSSYYSTNPDKGIEYGLKGVTLSKEIGWGKGEAGSYLSLGVNFQSLSNNPKAIEYYQKALIIYKEIGNKRGLAVLHGNMGNVYSNQFDYPKALKYYGKALKIDRELGNKSGVAQNLTNVGYVYGNQSDYPNALEYWGKASKIYEELGDKYGIAEVYNQIATVYSEQSDYPRSMDYLHKILDINEELGDEISYAGTLHNIARIYSAQSNNKKALEYLEQAKKINEKEGGNKTFLYNHINSMASIYAAQLEYDKSLEYYEKAMLGYKELGFKLGEANILMNMGSLFTQTGKFDKSLEYLKRGLKINEEIGNTRQTIYTLNMLATNYLTSAEQTDSLNSNSEISNLESELNSKRKYRLALKFGLKAAELADSIGLGELRYYIYQQVSTAYEGLSNYRKSLEYHKKFQSAKDSVFNQENSDKIAALEKSREDDIKQKEIEKQKIRIVEQEKREQLILYFSIGLVLLMAVVMIVIYHLLKRSDKLLYNVLPVSIAKRLKKKEHPISDYFTQASIVFIDIVDFTEHSKDADPRRVVEALNKIFTKYDAIANKYGLEKIKTIGDSYMAAAGIPEVQKDNTHRAAQMALEVKAMMQDYHTADGTKIEVRIGLDCGPVVAGVIGENKFIYDMWSDAVNTASRMESSSIAGEVHVSERFKEAVTEYEEFSYVERGEIEIKGKGKMKTFFMGEKKSVEV